MYIETKEQTAGSIGGSLSRRQEIERRYNMRGEAEIATIVRKLYAQEFRIATRLNAVESTEERRQLERDRRRLAAQRHALRWVLGEVRMIWLAEEE